MDIQKIKLSKFYKSIEDTEEINEQKIKYTNEKVEIYKSFSMYKSYDILKIRKIK